MTIWADLQNSAKGWLARSRVLSAAARGARAVPAKVWLGAAALVLLGLWMQEHDARLRGSLELESVRRQAAGEVRALESRAASARRQADERQAVIAALEAQRKSLAARGEALSAQLGELRRQQQGRAQAMAALPPGELAARLAGQLGAGSVTADSSAPGPLHLTGDGQRRVAAALEERDACREESALQEQRLANCRQGLAAGESEIRQHAASLAELRQALDAQEQVQAARQKQFDAELRAARGTWRSRAVRALKFLAVGAALGAVLR